MVAGNEDFLIKETAQDTYEMRVLGSASNGYFFNIPPQCPGGTGHSWHPTAQDCWGLRSYPASKCDHPECVCRDIHES